MWCSFYILPSHCFERSFSSDSLTSTPSLSILLCNNSSFASNSLFFILVSITVARNFSGPHALRDALLLAGADDALDFFLSARSSVCLALVHGPHDLSSSLQLSIMTWQSTKRKFTETSKWVGDEHFGTECCITVPGSCSVVSDVGSRATDLVR